MVFTYTLSPNTKCWTKSRQYQIWDFFLGVPWEGWKGGVWIHIDKIVLDSWVVRYRIRELFLKYGFVAREKVHRVWTAQVV